MDNRRNTGKRMTTPKRRSRPPFEESALSLRQEIRLVAVWHHPNAESFVGPVDQQECFRSHQSVTDGALPFDVLVDLDHARNQTL